jgi:hypothetical protein
MDNEKKQVVDPLALAGVGIAAIIGLVVMALAGVSSEIAFVTLANVALAAGAGLAGQAYTKRP